MGLSDCITCASFPGEAVLRDVHLVRSPARDPRPEGATVARSRRRAGKGEGRHEYSLGGICIDLHAVCRIAARAGACGSLPQSLHQDRGAVPGGRPVGRSGAYDRLQNGGGLEPAHRGGEQAGRQYRARRPTGREVRARRLHAPDGDQLHADHESVPLPHAAVRPVRGFRSHHVDRKDDAASHRQCRKRCQNRQGSHCESQSAAW